MMLDLASVVLTRLSHVAMAYGIRSSWTFRLLSQFGGNCRGQVLQSVMDEVDRGIVRKLDVLQ